MPSPEIKNLPILINGEVETRRQLKFSANGKNEFEIHGNTLAIIEPEHERAMLPFLWEYGKSENKPPIPDNLPDPVHSENALITLERRYQGKDAEGNIIEDPKEMWWRVAHNIATAELAYGGTEEDVDYWRRRFYLSQSQGRFLGNSPTLMNAGRPLQQLAACYVLPVTDSMEGILKAFRDAAIIHKSGGGTGFAFSQLRPEDDHVSTTGGVSSGPMAFIEMPNANTEAIKQGGTRRGANMGILYYRHPDLARFITAKIYEHNLNNFNISVGVDNQFIKQVKKDEPFAQGWSVPVDILKEIEAAYGILNAEARQKGVKSALQKLKQEFKAQNPGEGFELINPRDNQVVDHYNAYKVFETMVYCAWYKGDPGMVNLELINRDNPTPTLGVIEATNPCGEQPLLPYEACNLGSLNVAKFVDRQKRDFAWETLVEEMETDVRFLDNVATMNKYPIPEIDEICRRNRRIGLGVMGWADALILMGIPYDSEEAIKKAEEFASFMQKKVHEVDEKLAEERGVFPNWEISIYNPENDFPGSNQSWKGKRLRNACPLTIAPTGTISMIADCSGGIEPIFGLAFIKEVMDGTKLPYGNDEFLQIAKERGFYSDELWKQISKKGSIQDFEEIPEDVRALFKTAHDIVPEWHVRMQAAFQRHTDNAVSKTINFSNSATVDDVRTAYWLSLKSGNKGITVFRDGSKGRQVLKHGDHDGVGEIVLFEKEVEFPNTIKNDERARYYRIQTGRGPLHLFITDELYQAKENPNQLYWVPRRIFRLRRPPGDPLSTSEALKGMHETRVLKGPDPDYKEMTEDLLSIVDTKQFGMGPNRIASIDNGVGQVLLRHLLANGIFDYEEVVDIDPETDEQTILEELVERIRKKNLEPVSKERLKELRLAGVLRNGNGKLTSGQEAEIIEVKNVNHLVEGTTDTCPKCFSSNVVPKGSRCGGLKCLNPGCGFNEDCG